MLERRTRALRRLENAWAKYLGNPVPVEGKNAIFGYVPAEEVERIVDPVTQDSDTESEDRVPTGNLVDVEDNMSSTPGRNRLGTRDEDDLEARLLRPSRATIINPLRSRPTLRPNWWGKVDALDWYAEQFRLADEDVKRRRKGKFRPTGVAFVTFQSLAAAVC